MPLANYFETFFLQQLANAPDGFGGISASWLDDAPIQGLFAQQQSAEKLHAKVRSVNASGYFITDSQLPHLKEGSVIRRQRDNLYLRLTGKSSDSPAPALSKFRRFSATLTERPL